MLDQLPDFGSILLQISKSPNEHVSTPERETVANMLDMGPEQGTKTKSSIKVEPEGSLAKIQGSIFKECTSLEHIPCRSQSVTKVSEETSANISQVCSKVSEVPHHKQSSLKRNIQKRRSLSKKGTEKEIKFPELNTGTLRLGVPENFNFQSNDNISELESPKQGKSGQKTPEDKCIVEKLSAEMFPVEKTSKRSCECRKEEVDGADTLDKSVKELSDLKTDAIVKEDHSPESKVSNCCMKSSFHF